MCCSPLGGELVSDRSVICTTLSCFSLYAEILFLYIASEIQLRESDEKQQNKQPQTHTHTCLLTDGGSTARHAAILHV